MGFKYIFGAHFLVGKYKQCETLLPVDIQIYEKIDEANCRIICMYLAYYNGDGFPYEEYLKLDKSCYEDFDNLDEFSMYTHTFDGGESYVEFDDSLKISN